MALHEVTQVELAENCARLYTEVGSVLTVTQTLKDMWITVGDELIIVDMDTFMGAIKAMGSITEHTRVAQGGRSH